MGSPSGISGKYPCSLSSQLLVRRIAKSQRDKANVAVVFLDRDRAQRKSKKISRWCPTKHSKLGHCRSGHRFGILLELAVVIMCMIGGDKDGSGDTSAEGAVGREFGLFKRAAS